MSDIVPKWPQDILDRVKAAHHEPTLRERTAECPIPYKFVVMIEDPSIDDIDIEGIYDTLEEANQIALESFQASYSDFLMQETDMSNVYEKGTQKEHVNEVVWEFKSTGELSLVATDSDKGDQYNVWVEAHGN